MAKKAYRILLTLAAIVAVAAVTAGCGDTLTGPATMPALAIQPASAESAPVEIAIEATVIAVTDSSLHLGGSIAVGDPVNGWFIYDEDVVDIDDKPERGKYLFETAPFGMAVTIAGLQFRSDPALPSLAVRLDNAEPGGTKRDSARFSSIVNLAVLPGVDVADMTILLTDRTANALSSDSLAGTDPYHAGWPTKRQLTITGTDGWQIVAEIVSVVDPGDAEPPDPPGDNKRKFHQE
jgi:hypothetical protein